MQTSQRCTRDSAHIMHEVCLAADRLAGRRESALDAYMSPRLHPQPSVPPLLQPRPTASQPASQSASACARASAPSVIFSFSQSVSPSFSTPCSHLTSLPIVLLSFLPLSPPSCPDLPLTSRLTSTTSCLTTTRPHPHSHSHHHYQTFLHSSTTATAQQTHLPHKHTHHPYRIRLSHKRPQLRQLGAVFLVTADCIALSASPLTVSVHTANLVLVSCFPSFSTPP